jgi:hypothetical protein
MNTFSRPHAQATSGHRRLRLTAVPELTPDAGARPALGPALSALLDRADQNARADPSAPNERIANTVEAEARDLALAATADHVFAAALQRESRLRLCGGEISDVSRIVLLRMMVASSALTDPIGIDCALAHEETESLVLWTALQVHQVARLPPTRETQRWAASGTDPRTLRLLTEDRRPPISAD